MNFPWLIFFFSSSHNIFEGRYKKKILKKEKRKKEGCIYESNDILGKINNYDKIVGNNPNKRISYSQNFY